MYLLDYISCLFCLQKTLVTISNTVAHHDVFATLPWPIKSSHLSPQGICGLQSSIFNCAEWEIL